MIQVSIRIVAPAGKRAELCRALKSLQGPTQAMRGCRHCRILYDADDENALVYVEQWETQADLDEHLRSERCRRLLPLIDMSTEPPEVEYNTVSLMQGLEYWIGLLRAEAQS